MAPSHATSSLPATIQRNIKLARAQARLSQEDFATLVGVRGMTVSKWERGVQRPKDEHLTMLAAKLGLPGHWFHIDHEPERLAA